MGELPSIILQQAFWNSWNTAYRERELTEISLRQAEVVIGWLKAYGQKDLRILEVGCGTGWFCPQLLEFGQLTATDLSDEILARTSVKQPQVRFVAGDFMTLDFGSEAFDVIVTLEVLSHVADQRAFVAKLGRLLRPGGRLMLATQNRFVLERFNRVPPPGVGQLRRWVDQDELRRLLAPNFEVLELFSVTPRANRGIMRVIHSRIVNRPLRALFGNRIDRLKEALGLGWTLMAMARRPRG